VVVEGAKHGANDEIVNEGKSCGRESAASGATATAIIGVLSLD